MNVPLADLPAQYASLRAEINAAVRAVLESGQFGLSERVSELEARIAARCGARHGVGVNSGTDALLLSLMALGIGPGDEVITCPFTFVAPVEMIVLLGATPVFVDMDPATFNIAANHVEARITPRTRAILPIHLFGQLADVTALRAIAARHSLPLIGDAAQAIGSEHRSQPVAHWSELTTLSFFPTKNLGAAGDAGMVLTDDDALAGRLRTLRFHGSRGTYNYEYVGICSRLDSIQAAILGVKLPHLTDWTAARQRHAALYDAAFTDLRPVTIPCRLPGNNHTYHQYTLRVPAEQRDALRAFLAGRGVASGVYYPGPLHLEDAYARFGGQPGDFPETERACREVLSLPVVPELSEAQCLYVADCVRAFFDEIEKS